MSRLSPRNLPAFYEYDDVPFLVYTDEHNQPVAVSDLGIISSRLPEIVFEGELTNKTRFLSLAEKRNSKLNQNEKYKEVIAFYESIL